MRPFESCRGFQRLGQLPLRDVFRVASVAATVHPSFRQRCRGLFSSRRLHLPLLAAILFAACAAPQGGTSPPNPVAVVTPKPSLPGREIRLVEVDAGLTLEETGSFEVGDDTIVILEGSRDVTSYYAGLRVNDGPARWLDLHTAEERAEGATPESGWGWAHVALAPDGRMVVGVLDWFVESSGATLYVVTSDDGGRTWSLRAEIEKPHYMALFSELVLERDRWELTVRLDDCGGCDSLPGDTVWASSPGGDNWRRISEPTVPDRP